MTAGIIRRRSVTLAKNRVTHQVAAEVLARDLRVAGGCVMKFLGAPGECRNKWGEIHPPHLQLTMGHVREHAGGMRRSEVRWLVAGCWFHGVQGWELGHTQELRDYLAEHAA